MFVQHMIASLKPDGRMAGLMPHGILFRGGKEKLKLVKVGLMQDLLTGKVPVTPLLQTGGDSHL